MQADPSFWQHPLTNILVALLGGAIAGSLAAQAQLRHERVSRVVERRQAAARILAQMAAVFRHHEAWSIAEGTTREQVEAGAQAVEQLYEQAAMDASIVGYRSLRLIESLTQAAQEYRVAARKYFEAAAKSAQRHATPRASGGDGPSFGAPVIPDAELEQLRESANAHGSVVEGRSKLLRADFGMSRGRTGQGFRPPPPPWWARLVPGPIRRRLMRGKPTIVPVHLSKDA